MKRIDNPHLAVERLVQYLLRQQPPLHAPHLLELRVLDEIRYRKTGPWWRQSFLHWPIAARFAFAVACMGFVKVVLDVATWTTANLRSVFDLFPPHWLTIALFAGA